MIIILYYIFLNNSLQTQISNYEYFAKVEIFLGAGLLED